MFLISKVEKERNHISIFAKKSKYYYLMLIMESSYLKPIKYEYTFKVHKK